MPAALISRETATRMVAKAVSTALLGISISNPAARARSQAWAAWAAWSATTRLTATWAGPGLPIAYCDGASFARTPLV
jgi:hypothetical protein